MRVLIRGHVLVVTGRIVLVLVLLAGDRRQMTLDRVYGRKVGQRLVVVMCVLVNGIMIVIVVVVIVYRGRGALRSVSIVVGSVAGRRLIVSAAAAMEAAEALMLVLIVVVVVVAIELIIVRVLLRLLPIERVLLFALPIDLLQLAGPIGAGEAAHLRVADGHSVRPRIRRLLLLPIGGLQLRARRLRRRHAIAG